MTDRDQATAHASSSLTHAGARNHVQGVLKKIFLLILVAVPLAAALAVEPERSVIQIMTFSQQPQWDAPWRFDAVRRAGGSGFVIKGKKIVTNAHVIAWEKQVIVRKYQDPRPYTAKVEHVGNDCDLALLTVEDDSFFENLPALEFGALPKVRTGVVTYGYPAGGEQISYTKGVVSRIELQGYAHIGNRQFLGVQTDAAINPGNSGGPVIQDDLVVGVAFQGISGLENTGFFIPTPVMEHFLKDVEDGRYDGFPQAGVRLVALQNPAYRRMLKLSENDAGARVDSIVSIPSTQKVLKEDDVVLKIANFPVASDATILYEGNRVFAALAFQFSQHGESVPLKIWRDGKESDLSLPVYVYNDDRNTGNHYGTLPRYFVYGGLVFTPLSLDYVKTLGRNWADPSNAELSYEIYYRRHESPSTTRPEPIILASVLADPVNANFTTRGHAMVDKINGVRIEKLEDVIRAFESSTSAQDMIEFAPNHSFEALERTDVAKANVRILRTYGISKDRRL
ncbi:MAG: serine protease [Pedosphaera sp.]|nr:serine protease [Pedosphaera sp.]